MTHKERVENSANYVRKADEIDISNFFEFLTDLEDYCQDQSDKYFAENQLEKSHTYDEICKFISSL